MSAQEQRPKGLVWNVLGACFDLIGGNPAHGLPEPVAAFIRGEAAELPACLGWVPEHLRGLLQLMPQVYAGNAELRAGKVPPSSPSTAGVAPVRPLHFEPARPGEALALAGDVQIERLRPGSEVVWFTGTRAQIEAEGLTPPRWPAGREAVAWSQGAAGFRLERCRRRGWLANAGAPGDWWCVVSAAPGSARADLSSVRRLRRELDAAEYRASEAGRRAADRQFQRFEAAAGDSAFQAFLCDVLPPGVKLKSSSFRRAKAASVSTKGAAA